MREWSVRIQAEPRCNAKHFHNCILYVCIQIGLSLAQGSLGFVAILLLQPAKGYNYRCWALCLPAKTPVLEDCRPERRRSWAKAFKKTEGCRGAGTPNDRVLRPRGMLGLCLKYYLSGSESTRAEANPATLALVWIACTIKGSTCYSFNVANTQKHFPGKSSMTRKPGV